MNFKVAFAAASAVLAVSGAAFATDVPAGNYLIKTTVSKIPTSPAGNATFCSEFGEKVGAVGYAFGQYVAATSTAAGSFLSESDLGGTIYVDYLPVTKGKTLIGSISLSIDVVVAAFPAGVPTNGGPAAQVDVTFNSVTGTGPYTVARTTTLVVPSVGNCTYQTKETWTKF